MKTLDQDIKKTLEEFDKEFGTEKEVAKLNYFPSMEMKLRAVDATKELSDRVKSFLQQALEAEQAKREAMAREMIGEIKLHKVSKTLIKEQYECYDYDEAQLYEIENDIRDDVGQELIKIALKYGVEVE
jgi:hypothetical protein